MELSSVAISAAVGAALLPIGIAYGRAQKRRAPMAANSAASASPGTSEKRKFNRTTYAAGAPVSMTLGDRAAQAPEEVRGMLADGSFGGCSAIVFLAAEVVQNGQICWVSLDNLDAVPMKVAWVRHLQDKLYTLGLEFLEIEEDMTTRAEEWNGIATAL